MRIEGPCENFLNIKYSDLNKALPFLIFSNQFPYVDERLISKGGGSISNLFEINHILKLNGSLGTIDIE